MKNQLTVISTLGVILLFMFLFVRLMLPFTTIFIASGILAVLLSPVVDYLIKRFNWNRETASIIVLSVAILIFVIPATLLFTLLASEVSDLLHYVQLHYAVGRDWLMPYLADPRWQQEINSYSANILRSLSTNITAVFSRTFGIVIDLLLTIFVTNFFLARKSQIGKFLVEINPLKHEDAAQLTSRASEVVTATIRGYFSTVLLQMLIGISGFIIFGLPSPILFGITYGLASLIPMVGIAMVWMPAVLYLVATGKVVIAFGLVIWCIGLNLIMDNYVSPKIVGGGAKLHSLAVLFGVLGGIELFGFFGIVLGPTIMALTFSVLEMYKKLVKD